MNKEPAIQHWLVMVARAAGLPNADGLEIGSEVDLRAAWDTVGMRTETSSKELTSLVARHYRLEVAVLEERDPHAHKLVPGPVAKRLNVLPLSYSDRTLDVATADPVSLSAEGQLHRISARSIRFQVAAPEAVEAAVREAYPEAGELRHEVPPLPPDPSGAARRILVVDDDENMRVLLREVLEDSGFQVVEAEDGTKALEAIEDRGPFDLVTLDLKMHQMHGLDVLKRLRSRVATAMLPVVVATGIDDPDVEMELFEAGADDFVVKPVDPPRFLLRVQAVLRRRSSNPLADLI